MSTAIAIIPKPPVIEFRRCTGHCCDPVSLSEPPGYHHRLRIIEGDPGGDVKWIDDNLVYLGWLPHPRVDIQGSVFLSTGVLTSTRASASVLFMGKASGR